MMSLSGVMPFASFSVPYPEYFTFDFYNHVNKNDKPSRFNTKTTRDNEHAESRPGWKDGLWEFGEISQHRDERFIHF